MRLPLSCDARLDEIIEAQSLHPFHDEVGLALVRDAVLVCADDVLVAEGHADLPLRRLFQSLEATLKAFRL